jgi:hypothetical protein
VVADLKNATSMRAMTGTARVVLTTVGPYDHFGEPLIEACIATGTHVADITGEVPWVRRMRSKYEGAARDAGVRIVSMCGYDSVPSELGVRLLQTAAIEKHGRPAGEIEMAVGPIRGGVSGGTVASASNMIARARDPEIQNGPRGAGALCVEPPSHSIRSGEQWGIRRSSTLEIWTAPFFMAGINVSVVHRTHELLGRPWGDDFRYRECAAGDSGLRGFLKAALLAAGTIASVDRPALVPARTGGRSRRITPARWIRPTPHGFHRSSGDGRVRGRHGSRLRGDRAHALGLRPVVARRGHGRRRPRRLLHAGRIVWQAARAAPRSDGLSDPSKIDVTRVDAAWVSRAEPEWCHDAPWQQRPRSRHHRRPRRHRDRTRRPRHRRTRGGPSNSVSRCRIHDGSRVGRSLNLGRASAR